MKIAIVDDEPLWRRRAEERIRAFYDFPVEICQFPSGESFLQADLALLPEQEPFDIVFLDVEMDDGPDGFECTIQFKNRHPKTPVILLTAHGEFSRRGYRVKAFRYLEKQYLEEIDEALESIGLINPKDRWITLPLTEGGQETVRTIDICSAEAISHGALVQLSGRTLKTTHTLQKLEQLLGEEEHFYRCHQGYIVNWKYIKDIRDWAAVTTEDRLIPISRRRLRTANDLFVKYHFRRASR